MTKGLYAIRDNVASAIVGGVHVHAHDAPAIRMFSDVAASKGTQVEQHLADFDLIHIAQLDDESGCITDVGTNPPRIVLAGAVLKATWEAQAQNSKEA